MLKSATSDGKTHAQESDFRQGVVVTVGPVMCNARSGR